MALVIQEERNKELKKAKKGQQESVRSNRMVDQTCESELAGMRNDLGDVDRKFSSLLRSQEQAII